MSGEPSSIRRRVEAAWLGACLALLAACSSPSGATPMPEPLALDPERIGAQTILAPMPFVLRLDARPGAATSGSTVRLTNLDAATPIQTTLVRSDGSFAFELESVETGDELRLQAERDGRRGPPLDFSTVVGVAPSARHACVALHPGYEVAFEGASVRTLELENRCDSELTLSAPRTRLGLAEFSVDAAPEATLSPGARHAFDVAFIGAADEALEETWFVDVSVEGRTIRYPVTWYAPASAP